MKLFQERELLAAYEHAKKGGQALHLFGSPGPYPGAPACFKRSKEAGHLFDYDRHRLIRTAKRFGVRIIRIGRLGRQGQHIDLCGRPLEKAKAECEVTLFEENEAKMKEVIGLPDDQGMVIRKSGYQGLKKVR